MQTKFRQNEAKSTPLTDKEKEKWEGIPVRRCPACLDCTSSRCSSCLLCKAVFLCRPILSADAPPDAEDERVRPKAKTQQKAKAKAKPPVYTPESNKSTPTPPSASAAANAPDDEEVSTPRLNLPEVSGVVWKTYEHSNMTNRRATEKRRECERIHWSIECTKLLQHL